LDPGTSYDQIFEDGSGVDGQTRGSNLPESRSDRNARWHNELAVRSRTFDHDALGVAHAYSRNRTPSVKITRIVPSLWIGYVGFKAYPRPDHYREIWPRPAQRVQFT